LKTAGSGEHDARHSTGGRVLGELLPVTFRFPNALAPTAMRVSILGTFNGWAAGVHAMQKAQGSYWAITLYLPPGRAVYCFEVDGARWLDPHDDARVPNSGDQSTRSGSSAAGGASGR
jgi:1,4-alpha-glucan branching enzyme